jgi:hypothetical protein
MSYQQAMEAAGAKVLAYEEFGSYQGDWLAKVVYNGETGFVQGTFGSCTGCDAFQAEFDYSEPFCEDHQYQYPRNTEPCDTCKVKESEYQTRLADFGRNYLLSVQTYEEALKYAKRNSDWDSEANEMVKWLERNQ